MRSDFARSAKLSTLSLRFFAGTTSPVVEARDSERVLRVLIDIEYLHAAPSDTWVRRRLRSFRVDEARFTTVEACTLT